MKKEYSEVEQDDNPSLLMENFWQQLSLAGKHSGRPNFVLLCASFAMLNLCIGVLIGYGLHAISRPSPRSVTINPNTAIPLEVFTSRHDVPFSPDPRYMGPSHEVNQNWAKLTQGSDSIYLPDPSLHDLRDPGIRAPFFIFNDLPPSAKALDNVNNFFVLNDLHQLHCVNMIRKRYNTLVYKHKDVSPLANTTIDADWITHLEHCFEYLRLSITCGDFMVFETDSPPGSPEEYWKDGLSWGVVHSCVDWERLIEFQTEQVALYNSTWS